jgi:peptidoglycan/LPS O-acetylase OafA/YrhL
LPVWLQNTLIGLVIFVLGSGWMPQYLVCALALGVAVWQLRHRRAAWLWTGASFAAAGLFVLGAVLAIRYEPLWPIYFGAWVFVIVALVGEGSRVFRRPPTGAPGSVPRSD